MTRKMKSIDRGTTWFPIHNDLDSVGHGTDIEIDPTNSDILYFSRISIFDSVQNCLSKSIDGGQTWTDITPDSLSLHYIKRVKVSLSNSNKIYIGTSEQGVWISNNGGETWNPFNNGLKYIQPASLEIDASNGSLLLGTYYDAAIRNLFINDSRAF